MTISVLATKCRFCGEEVGKPKDELRELTASDLGGETIFHRAASGSVMEALESYRVEQTQKSKQETARKAATNSSLFGRKKKNSDSDIKSDPDLPELDARSQDLASIADEGQSLRERSQVPKREQTIAQRLTPIVGGVVVLVLAVFGGVKGIGWYHGYLAEKNKPPVVQWVNQAPKYLEAGANFDPLKALEFAVEALDHVDTPENRAISEQSLTALQHRINEYLDADPWSMASVRQASALATRAAFIYPNEATRRLQDEVKKEYDIYSSVLTSTLDGVSAAKSATFKLVSSSSTQTLTVEEDDLIADRFQVLRITRNKVVVKDLVRKDRRGNSRSVAFETNAIEPLQTVY